MHVEVPFKKPNIINFTLYILKPRLNLNMEEGQLSPEVNIISNSHVKLIYYHSQKTHNISLETKL